MRTQTKIFIGSVIFLAICFAAGITLGTKVRKKIEAKKQAELGELEAIKSDIANIYIKMILIHQEIGDHEVRIHKLEPESATLKTYLKNVKILTDTINIHRRELKKCQTKKQ